jgi:hypothetical protein
LFDAVHDYGGLCLDVVVELSWRVVESFIEWDIKAMAILCESLVL